MSFLDNMKEQTTVGRTENGAKTYTSSLSANLDFFGQAGAMRTRIEDVKNMFSKAYDENKELALRNLVHLRNIRLGGLGEREAFREAFKYVVDTKNEKTITTMLNYVAYIGRWDDLLAIWQYAIDRGATEPVESTVLSLIANQLKDDITNYNEGKEISLLAKWVPNINVHKKSRRAMAYRLARKLGFEQASGLRKYRKMIANLRNHLNLVEVRLASKEYDKIDFEKLPSKALFRYRKAFETHMPKEYANFLAKVESGDAKLNAKLMLPHEIVRAYRSTRGLDRSLEATWNALTDVLEGVEDNAIVVADTSGSMTWDGGLPYDVAQGLAIYTAERLEGAFKGHFITFDDYPELIQLPISGTLTDKMYEYDRHSLYGSTNIQRVFDLILTTAVANRTPQTELPTKIVIISDMEFNQGVRGHTNFESAKQKFKNAGYELPNVIFWNVNSRQNNMPVRKDENGVALVSGFTPNILRQVLGAPIVSPEALMLDVLNSPNYDFVRNAL